MTDQDRRDDAEIAALAERILARPTRGNAYSLDDVVEARRRDIERRTLTDSDVWMRLEAIILRHEISDVAKQALQVAMAKL